MGASGIGKTTLLRILMGLERADSGCISGIDTKKHILYVSGGQAYSLSFCNRKCQNSASWKNNRDEIRNNLLSILPHDSLDIPVSSLSGGMKKAGCTCKSIIISGQINNT